MDKFAAKVILTVGISNCGKSTWAKGFIKKNPMYIEINRDDLRIALFCDGDRSKYNSYKFSREKEGLVTKISETRAEFAVSNGQGIIISDTNLNDKTRAFWTSFADLHGLELELEIFDVPLHVCLDRNSKRDITFYKSVILRQYSSFRKFMNMPVYTPDTSKPKAFLCDLDGTLLHNTNRKIFDYERVDTDTIDPVVEMVVDSLINEDMHMIIFTGREDIGSCKAKTLALLDKHDVIYTSLYMRKLGDHRSDVIVKEEMFWNIADDYNIVMAIDDRDQVVDLWRSLGIKTLQCDYGQF